MYPRPKKVSGRFVIIVSAVLFIAALCSVNVAYAQIPFLFPSIAKPTLTNATTPTSTNATTPTSTNATTPTSTNATTPTSTNAATSTYITLGNPFYIESNKIISQVPVPLRSGGNASGITFVGNGTVQGIGFKEIGRALIIPISSKIVDIEGGLLLKSNDSSGKGNGNATLSFREIGHVIASGLQGSGAAIFNPNATGNLSFLNNKVAVFTHNGNRDGTNMIKAWEWK